MPKYELELVESVAYTVTVEAADISEAEKKAKEMWANSETPTEDFNGIGEGVHARYIDLCHD